jgi:PAS domain S-box-containing protein
VQAIIPSVKLTHTLHRYLIAVTATGVGLLLRLLMWSVLGSSVPYITFFPAVAVTAWLAGLGPGVLCTVLSGVTTLYFFIEPHAQPQNEIVGDALGLLLFLSVGSFIAWLTELQTSARRLAEQRLHLLERESTERKSAQHAAVEANRKLRAIISASPLPIIAVAPDGSITLWNPAAEQVFGWQEAEVVGKPMPHVPENKTAEFRDMRARDLAGQGFRNHEIERRRKDGSTVHLAISTAPIHGSDGNVIGTMAIYADLTQRRLAEEELRANAEELRKANRELEEFAFIASHDLQEPLRMVSLYTQLLMKKQCAKDPDSVDIAQYIISGVRRMRSLIEDVLAYSRVLHAETDAGDTADLDAALADALMLLKHSIMETGAIIDCDRLPRVRGNQRQLAQVFQNLLSNAIKYRKTDQAPRIRIHCCRNGNEWILSIQDDGIGFDQQYAARIFGLFKRLHKDQYPGTGLGLAICKRVIEQYGGRIWAESESGTGSTFYFALNALET